MNEIEALNLNVQCQELQYAEPATTPTEAREESNNDTQSPVTAVPTWTIQATQ